MKDEINRNKEHISQVNSSIENNASSLYKMRPAGRHILTIGAELIQDPYAAIVELVKNCYDADSPDAIIVFKRVVEEDILEIQVIDHGHGMTTKDVTEKWLVPSTDYKASKRFSPKGRIMQGRKGIGRYAASILGNNLIMQTVDSQHVLTEVAIDWSQFKEYEYLDQVQFPIRTYRTEKGPGTKLIMRSKFTDNKYWNENTFSKLRFELKKLIPPTVGKEDSSSVFDISLKFDNYFENTEDNTVEPIKPYPILDYFDYRISGKIEASGGGELIYENHKIEPIETETVLINYGETGCGSLDIDIRVYDRDKESIEQLISRGLKDERGSYVKKNQARALLNDVNGIGVYRNGFRIRPLGDADFDWLKLNEQRVQRPSIKIGSNQVVGYVHIQSEESSGLEEKSARDGLKENDAYNALRRVTKEVISELEKRRFIFRRKSALIDPTKKVADNIDILFDYSELSHSISRTLKKAELSETVINQVDDIISKEAQKKNKTAEEIKKAVAIYQGQATLGKVINVILHEGRRPLNYIKNQSKNLSYYGVEFKKSRNDNAYQKVIELTAGIAQNADSFADLFGRLDTLSARTRISKRKILVAEAINEAVAIFNADCEKDKINVVINCDKDLSIQGWKQDFIAIFVNLLDNSIFWFNEKECVSRVISFNARRIDGIFQLDYTDSGPGISDELLENSVIFEPEFTTKENGTGLGLAIAGEAASRNDLELTAVHDDNGAHFILRSNRD